MSRKKISKDKSIRKAKFYTELVICLAVLGIGVYSAKKAFDHTHTVEQSSFCDDADIEESTTLEPPAEPDPNKVIYESSSVMTKDKYKGDLILVNEDHQYFGGNEALVSILEKNEEKGIDFYTAVDYDYTILSNVYEPMTKMISDFYDKYKNNTLIIYGSYRTTEFQKQLYEEDLAQTGEADSSRVAKPGFSEHESGYAFDFSETVNYDYDGTGDFEWINKNCYKYGFILRYPENKKEITKMDAEPWHFRYVGLPHSYYMTKNDLCLEEYIELLKKYPYEGEHLEITCEDGSTCEVYYVQSDDGSETTSLPVPAGKQYTVSGNNCDGFIITVYNDGIPDITQVKSEASETPEADIPSDNADTAEKSDAENVAE